MKHLFTFVILTFLAFGQGFKPGYSQGYSSGPNCEVPGTVLDKKQTDYLRTYKLVPEGSKWTQPWGLKRTFTCVRGMWYNADVEKAYYDNLAKEKHNDELRTATLTRVLSKEELLEVVKSNNGLWSSEESYWHALLQQFLIRQVSEENNKCESKK